MKAEIRNWKGAELFEPRYKKSSKILLFKCEECGKMAGYSKLVDCRFCGSSNLKRITEAELNKTRKQEQARIAEREAEEAKKERKIEQDASWRQTNASHIKTYNSNYYQTHREEIKKKMREARKSDPQRFKQYSDSRDIERRREVQRAYWRRKKGLTPEQYRV